MKKTLTEKEIRQTININGWFISLLPIIIMALDNIMTTFGLNIDRFTFWMCLMMCVLDRAYLKTYKGINISIWRCLLMPVYLYKRCKELREPMTQFYINLSVIILQVIFGLAVILYFYL